MIPAPKTKGRNIPQRVREKAQKTREEDMQGLREDMIMLSSMDLTTDSLPVTAPVEELKRKVLIIHVTWSDRSNILNSGGNVMPKLNGSQIYNLVFSSDNGSVNDYYKELFATSENVVLPAVISNPLDGCQGIIEVVLDGKHTEPYSQAEKSNLMADAITKACAEGLINLKDFDTNGNGILEATELSIGFIVDGFNASVQTTSPGFHATAISNPNSPEPSETNSVKIKNFFGIGAFNGRSGIIINDMVGIGTICHELGHSAYGFIDVYDYGTLTGEKTSNGHGFWSLMSRGSHSYKTGQRDGLSPSYPDAYNLVKSGIVRPGVITVQASPTLSSHLDIYIVNNPNPKQYFLLQQRKYGYTDNFDRGGFSRMNESANASHGGLLIYHVDESVPLVRINDKPGHYFVAIEEAHGGTQHLQQKGGANYGDLNDLWGISKTEFSPVSDPSSGLYGAFTNDSVLPDHDIDSETTIYDIIWSSLTETTTFSYDNPHCYINDFSIPGSLGSAIIDQDAKTIILYMPMGTDLASLSPTVSFIGNHLAPGSGFAQDFNKPVTYTVMASTGDINTYTVKVVELTAPDGVTFSDIYQPQGESLTNSLGRYIYYGKYDGGADKPRSWQVVGEEDNALVLLQKDAYSNERYQYDGSWSQDLIWSQSKIYKYLNNMGSPINSFTRFFMAGELSSLQKTDIQTIVYDGVKRISFQDEGNGSFDTLFYLACINSNVDNITWSANLDNHQNKLLTVPSKPINGNNDPYWLRSRYLYATAGSGESVGQAYIYSGTYLSIDWFTNSNFVRPLFKLQPNQIIFISEIGSSGIGSTAANDNYEAGTADNKNFKLTVPGGNAGGDVGTLSGVPTGTITLTSAGCYTLSGLSTIPAMPGNFTINYKIVQDLAGTRIIVGYGSSADLTTLNIDTSGLREGESYTVHVWLQKNNDVQSHEATMPQYFTLKITNPNLNCALVSASSLYSAAIKADGSLWAWGNSSFEAPVFNEETIRRPFKVGEDDDWALVSAGSSHTMLIKTDGSLWGLGSNYYGQLGDGTGSDKTFPARIGTASDWALVSAGDSHTVAIKADGSLWAWGDNEHGELGNGNTFSSIYPLQIGTGKDWVIAVAGWQSTAAIKADGSLWVWGHNLSEESGIVQYINRHTPYKVMDDVEDVSLGLNHTLVQKRDGSLWSWGDNGYGKLGNGTYLASGIPQRIGTENDWAAAFTGKEFSIAIKTDGSLWSWGDNRFWQLGHGFEEYTSCPIPVRVGTELDWIAASGGDYHTIAYKTDGSLWAWGNNGSSQLGDGTTEIRGFPAKIMPQGSIISFTPFAVTDGRIAAGEAHAMAVKEDDSLWAWGLNTYGRLGDGSTTQRNLPVKIMDNVAKTAAGNNHSAAIKNDCSLWTWGYNNNGQLGDGTTSQKTVPVKIMEDVTEIDCGGSFSAAIQTDGSLWTWGSNTNGRLGDGSTAQKTRPVKIMVDVKTVACGTAHAAAVKNDGSLWTWGLNTNGRLGDGTSTQRTSPVKIMDGVNEVACGDAHTIALKDDGSLWAWGLNTYGRLGDGTTTQRTLPVKIMNDVAQIKAGSAHTIALKTDGSVWTWGYNNNGQLGDGSTSQKISPVKIMDNMKMIGAGSAMNIAVKIDGSLWTWGSNTNGRLGDGTTTQRNAPVKVMPASSIFAYTPDIYKITFDPQGGSPKPSPQSIPFEGTVQKPGFDPALGGQIFIGWYLEPETIPYDFNRPVSSDFTLSAHWLNMDIEVKNRIAAGEAHGMAIMEDNSLLAWGLNTYGRLGDGSTTQRNLPVPILAEVAEAAAGKTHSAAIKADRSLWTWGYNNYGQLGDGSTTQKTSPVKIMDVVLEVACGDSFTAAIQADGSLWTWGLNTNGRLGDGTTANKSKPVKIMENVSRIACGTAHAAAVKTDGSLWAWGTNTNGRLGDGSTSHRTTPVKIMDDVAAVSCGDAHTIALKTDGSLWAWGLNTNGRLGDGTTTQRTLPIKIMDNVKQISAGSAHTIALKTDGSLWAWGYNNSGQLGDGTTTQRTMPHKIMDNIEMIAAGYSSNVAVKIDGSLWTWGSNTNGRLGDGTTIQRNIPVKIMAAGSILSYTPVIYTVTFDVQEGSLAPPSQNIPFEGEVTRPDPDPALAGYIFAGWYLEPESTAYDFSKPVASDFTLTAHWVSLGTELKNRIAAGEAHTMEIRIDDTLWAWGLNTYGRLGDGTTTQRTLPVKIMENVAEIAAGNTHSAAIKTDRTLWTWGYNNYGQLGDGSTSQKTSPVKIMDYVLEVSCGGSFSAAIQANGSLWTWGYNLNGRLGDGSTANKNKPVKIMENVKQVSCGTAHAAAVKSDGSLWAWGLNTNGRLGDGTTTQRTAPVKIMDNVMAVSCGDAHTIALKTDGSLWAWGLNTYGRLGDGTTTQRTSPVKIMDGVAKISAGQTHTIVLKTDNTVWTWGYNNYGQIGDGSVSTRTMPVKIMDNGMMVVAGYSMNAVIGIDNSLWTWGYNNYSKLGDGTTTNRVIPIMISPGNPIPFVPAPADPDDSGVFIKSEQDDEFGLIPDEQDDEFGLMADEQDDGFGLMPDEQDDEFKLIPGEQDEGFKLVPDKDDTEMPAWTM
ncbi:MAG: InlB B-repeat-containing protein [Clostridiales bacterium]|nr:InlB B-repeat-containing protein [Clostridiales bacterium]